MSKTIFTLTAKGRKELTARRGSLPPELGSLLVLIDGRRTRGELLSVLGRTGDDVSLALRRLAQAGYIEPLAAPAPAHAAPDDDLAQRFQILSSYLTDAVQQHLGLRGFAQQLRIDRASTLAELVARVEPLANAIARAADRRTANDFVETARALLESPSANGL